MTRAYAFLSLIAVIGCIGCTLTAADQAKPVVHTTNRKPALATPHPQQQQLIRQVHRPANHQIQNELDLLEQDVFIRPRNVSSGQANSVMPQTLSVNIPSLQTAPNQTVRQIHAQRPPQQQVINPADQGTFRTTSKGERVYLRRPGQPESQQQQNYDYINPYYGSYSQNQGYGANAYRPIQNGYPSLELRLNLPLQLPSIDVVSVPGFQYTSNPRIQETTISAPYPRGSNLITPHPQGSNGFQQNVFPRGPRKPYP